MVIPLLLLLIVISLYVSYLYGLAAGTLYLSDYDKKKYIKSVPERRKKHLYYLFDNSRLLAVTNDLMQSLTLAVVTIASFILGNYFQFFNLPFWGMGLIFAVVGLLLYIAVVELLVPATRQDKALSVISSRVWLIRLVGLPISIPAKIVINWREMWIDKKDLEDRKEEIVERAIEELADSAGIDEPLLEQDEREMISKILDLDETEVIEVMVPRVEMIGVEMSTSYTELKKIAIDSGFSRFPLYKEDIDNIKGILYVKDLYMKVNNDDDFNLRRLARPAFFVPESKKLDTLLEDFKLRHAHIAIVVDEFGGTSGLITFEDLLEEIVGDIQDEHDTEEADVVKISEDTFVVSANISMEELSESLDLKLEEKDFETVGGYIYDLVGSLPRVGQKITAEGLEFTVQSIDGQRIDKVKIFIPAVSS